MRNIWYIYVYCTKQGLFVSEAVKVNFAVVLARPE